MNITNLLEKKFKDAFSKAGFDNACPVVLQEAGRPEFGDYQVNGVMAIAKDEKLNPRELAAKVVSLVEIGDVISKLEVAGPGFINVTLSDSCLSQTLNPDLLKVVADKKRKIVVDYSSPNLAKEMHVGHLRSTIIGDALVRLYEFLGHEVIRRNHVGDWGTQFGMIVAYLIENKANATDVELELRDLEDFYRKAKLRFDEDETFAQKAHECVVKLQSGDPKILEFWHQFVEISIKHCQEVYDKLGVKLEPSDVVGESYYNDLLPVVVEELMAKKIAVDSDGAKCVFFAPGELDVNDETPFIIQKKDGAYLYATTDIAAVYDRIEKLHASYLVYVIGAPQSLHMKQLFATVKKAGMTKTDTLMEHVSFGAMLDEDGRPFKTRAGGTIKLMTLIDEAIKRASLIVSNRNPDWRAEDVSKLANILGVAAMKYADLSKNRVCDYIFSIDRMLAFDGNTAPYMLYAYVRIVSIFKKANLNLSDYLGLPITITHPDERSLALHLCKFRNRLLRGASENCPHYICAYIYELAGLFMRFYENCHIMQSKSENKRTSRLAISALTAKVLEISLDLLGISVVDQM